MPVSDLQGIYSVPVRLKKMCVDIVHLTFKLAQNGSQSKTNKPSPKKPNKKLNKKKKEKKYEHHWRNPILCFLT